MDTTQQGLLTATLALLVRLHGYDTVKQALLSGEPAADVPAEEEETNPGPYCADGEFYFDMNGRSIGPYATEEDAEEAFDDLARERYQEEIRATQRAESGYAQ